MRPSWSHLATGYSIEVRLRRFEAARNRAGMIKMALGKEAHQSGRASSILLVSRLLQCIFEVEG